MSIQDKIDDWKKYPNALGSEAQVAVIIGEVANAIGEEIPANVSQALKTLALRGTMRDIAAAIQRGGEENHPGTPSFHDVVDVGALAAGLSWTEAISQVASYLDRSSGQLG